MSAASLLAELRQKGVELLADGEQLRWRAPRGVLGEGDLERLRAAKPELLALLAPPHAWLERRTWEWRAHLHRPRPRA